MSDTASPRKIPAPQATPETEETLKAAAQGVLMIGRCSACGRAHYYPRALCPFCFGASRLEAASGEAEIYTFSVTYRGVPEPYAIGYATLKEGPRILTNFIGRPLEELRIGQAVRVVFQETDGGAPVPCFAPSP